MKKSKLIICMLVLVLALSGFVACVSPNNSSSTSTGNSSSSSSASSSSSSSTTVTPEPTEYTLTLYVDGNVYSQTQLVEGSDIELPTPEQANYTFSGWYTDSELTQSYTAGEMPASNLNLYGAFSPVVENSVSVTYVYGFNSQTVELENGSLLTDSKANEIANTLTSNDYTFVGWNTENGESYTFGSAIESDLTLVANYYSNGLEIDGGLVIWFDGKNNEVVVPAKIGETEITGIEEFAFERTKVTSVYLSEGIKTVGDLAFSNCANLTDVYLPTTLESLGLDVFSGSPSLVNGGIHFEGSETYPVENGLAYADSAKTQVMLYVGEKGASVELPETVTAVLARAFENMNIDHITVSSSVTEIGSNAFTGSLITSVNYNSDLNVPEGCFKNCEQLERINIANGVKAISANAFEGCKNLSDIVFPDSLESIGTGAFLGCVNLKEAELPEGYRNFTGGEFAGAGIEYFKIPSYLTEIGENMFANWTYLKEITIPEGVVKIGNGAFAECRSLESIAIPSTVQFLGRERLATENSVEYKQTGSRVFFNCVSLKTVDFSQATSLKFIATGVFMGCSLIENLEIPESVEIIDENAFMGMSALKTIKLPFVGRMSYQGWKTYMEAMLVDLGAIMNTNGQPIQYNGGTPILTLNGTETLYEKAEIYSKLSADNVKLIRDNGFNAAGQTTFNATRSKDAFESFMQTPDYTSTSAIGLFGSIFGTTNYPGSVLTYQYLSGGQTNYTYYIPATLKQIEIYNTEVVGAYAFNQVRIPEIISSSIKVISHGAFSGADMAEFKLPENVTSIGPSAFAGITVDNGVIIIPDRVDTIGERAFASISNLKSIKLPNNSNLYVAKQAFASHRNTTAIYQEEQDAGKSGIWIHRGKFGNYAFIDCDNITSAYIGEDVIYAAILSNYGVTCGLLQSIDNLESVEIYSYNTLLPDDCDQGKGGDIVQMLPGYIFNGCELLKTINGSSVYSIPEGVTMIGPYVFQATMISGLVLPTSLVELGYAALNETYLAGELDLRYVEKIDALATAEVYNVTRIIINKDVEFTNGTNGGFFFRDHALTTIALYDSQTGTITHNEEGTAYIPSMEVAAPDLISETAIAKVVFTDPERITSIGSRFASACTKLTYIEIPKNVASIGTYAFADCTSLAEIKFLGNNLKEIGWEAFRNTAIVEIVIPEGVEDMSGTRIFGGCTNLESVVLPSTLKKFCSTDGFKNCPSLKSLTVLATYPPDVDGGDMQGGSMLKNDSEYANVVLPQLMSKNGFRIYIPADSMEAYKNHRGTYGYFLRNAEGWTCYSDAFVPLYSGKYVSENGESLTVYQTKDNGEAIITVNEEQITGSVATTKDANGVYTSVYTYGENTLTVSGLNAVLNANGAQTSMVRITGVYTDIRGDFGLNNKFENYSVEDKDGQEINYVVEDYGTSRLWQFRHQLHLQADGSVQIYEFDENRAYTEKNYYYVGDKLNSDNYVHIYPATVYSGTYKIENGNVVMTFTDYAKYKLTYTFTTDKDAVVTGAVSFTLTVAIADINQSGINASSTEYLAKTHVYTR